MDISKVNTLCFSGGGIKAICLIGFFKSMYNYIDINQIKHYIGTSAGAIISLCMNIGYSIDEITTILLKYDFNKLFPSLETETLDDLLLNFGLSDGNEIKKFIVDLIEYKFNNKSNITFLELYELTNIKLTVATTNFTSQTIEYWNYINTPNNLIVDGMMATSRVPFVYTPLKINGNYYLDGGLINNYPIEIIPTHEIDTVIGICLTTTKNTDDIKNLFDMNNKYDKIISYMIDILMIAFNSKLLATNKLYMDRTIMLENKFANFLDIDVSDDIKNSMINTSFDITNDFFKNNNVKPISSDDQSVEKSFEI